MTTLEQGQVQKSFDDAALAAGDGTVFALPAQAVLVTWQTSFVTPPSAVDISIQTSLDNISWSDIANTTNTAGATGSFVTSAIFIRAIVNSATDGDTFTVQLVSKNALLGIIDPNIVTDGSLVIYAGTSGSQFGELPFSGNGTDSLLGDGTFGPPFDQSLNQADDVVFNSVTATYNSSDTSPGISTTITTASLVGKTITVKDGLITGFA